MRPDRPSDPPQLGLEIARGAVVYTDEGQGPVIVALHGAPGSTRDWRWLGAALDGRARLVRIGLPGLGETPLETEPGTDFGSQASLVLDALTGLGIERAHLVGHSMGGGIAVAAAHLSPDRVAGIGLLASLGLRAHHGLQASRPKLSWGLLSMPFVGRAIRPVLPVAFKAFGFPGDQPVEALVRVMQLAANVDVLAHAERVRTLPVPALVAWTDDDRLITSDISRELSEAAPEGPRLCWPEGGHFLLKTRSVELADALVAWVATPEALIPRGPLSETS